MVMSVVSMMGRMSMTEVLVVSTSMPMIVAMFVVAVTCLA
jgi:hypothetical protein